MCYSVRLMAQARGGPTVLSEVRAMQACDSPPRDARAGRSSGFGDARRSSALGPSADIQAGRPCDSCALDSSGALS